MNKYDVIVCDRCRGSGVSPMGRNGDYNICIKCEGTGLIMATMKVKKLNDMAEMPHKQTEGSAGYDLYAELDEAVDIEPGKTVMIQTGLVLEIPVGYFGGIYARSGIAVKNGIRPATCVSVIDSDYRGEVVVPLHNDSDTVYTINPGERIAQLVLHNVPNVMVQEVDIISETSRGTGGFGSTGV